MPRTLCILLLFPLPVCGQVSSSFPTNAAASTAYLIRYTAADTVAALHQMFHTRRAGGFTLVGLGIGAQVASPLVAAQLPSNYGSYGSLYNYTGGIIVGFAIALPLTIFGGNALSKYSKKTEKTVVALYQETRMLPSKFEGKLVSGRFLTPN